MLVSRRNRAGKLLWIRSSGKPLFEADGRFIGYIGTGTDVTAEINARQDAEKRFQLFIDAMESMSDGFVLFDSADRMVFCNSAFRKQNPELSPELVVGITFEDMVQSNLRNKRILEAVGRESEFLRERMERHRNPPQEPLVTHRRDGRILLLREVRLEDGGCFLINTDQTELRRREDELRRSRNEAQEASKAKSDFLARMSHELRTPLNAIIGFSDVMKSGTVSPGRYKEYAADIHESGQHLLALVEGLLDLNAIEAGRRDLHVEPVHPRDLVVYALKTVRPIAQRAKVRLRGSAPKSLPILMLDSRAAIQCLLNLLSNAIKFSKAGDTVSLTGVTKCDGSVCLVVTDTGPGMDVEAVGRGHRPHTLSKDQQGKHGAGLGLMITRALLEKMGGSLSIDSEIGKGTHATLYFASGSPDKQA